MFVPNTNERTVQYHWSHYTEDTLHYFHFFLLFVSFFVFVLFIIKCKRKQNVFVFVCCFWFLVNRKAKPLFFFILLLLFSFFPLFCSCPITVQVSISSQRAAFSVSLQVINISYINFFSLFAAFFILLLSLLFSFVFSFAITWHARAQ